MKKGFFFLVSVLILCGCMSERKRQDIFHRYARENRDEVLAYAPEPEQKFVEGKTDTIIRRDTVTRRVPYYLPGNTDTVWVDCPASEVVKQFILRTDTIRLENTAAVEAALLRERKAREERVAAESQADVFREQAGKRLRFATISVVIAIISVVLYAHRLLKV